MRTADRTMTPAPSGALVTLGQQMVHLIVTHDHVADTLSAPRTEGFIGQRTVADALSVRNFFDWADHRVDVSTLRLLRLQSARFRLGEVIRAQYELRQARDAWRSSSDTAWAITSVETGRVLRGLVPDNAPLVLLRAGNVTIWLDANGLHLSHRDTMGEFAVSEWAAADEWVSVTTSGGEVTLFQDPSTTFALSLIAASTHRARVERVPLERLFGPLLAPVFEMADLAAHCQATMHSRIGAPMR